MRHVFEINNLNLTEFARSFALYKNLMHKGISKYKNEHKNDKKRLSSKRDDKKEGNDANKTVNLEDQKLFSKRLKKSQQKDLERKIGRVENEREKEKYLGRLNEIKREVYTNEDKVALRKQNFEKAKYSVGKKVLSEFM